MSIQEITFNEELYDAITENDKVIMYFYTNWNTQCTKFNFYFIKLAQQYSKNNIVFCKINVDKMPDAQIVYDVNVQMVPRVIFLYKSKIVNSFYGNKPELFEDFVENF